MSNAITLTGCQLPGCWAIFEQSGGRGRPRRYCSDEHRNEAHDMRRRVEARLAALREQVRRDEHLLAALGGDDTPEARTTCGAGLDGECYEDGCPQRDPATRTTFCPLPATGLVALREGGEQP